MSYSISVIIPTYNSAHYLRQALTSVIQQTRAADEIIVVDDGSTDDTQQVVDAFGVSYVYQPNAGAAAARNKGVELAQGNLIAFLDADDLWMPTKLAQQAHLLETGADVDMVFGHIEQFVSPDVEKAIAAQIYCPSSPSRGYLPTALMIRKASWQRVGPLETSWAVGEFVSWYLLAQEKGLTSQMLPVVVARRRLHRMNQGVVKRESRQDYLHIVKAALARRRQVVEVLQ